MAEERNELENEEKDKESYIDVELYIKKEWEKVGAKTHEEYVEFTERRSINRTFLVGVLSLIGLVVVIVWLVGTALWMSDYELPVTGGYSGTHCTGNPGIDRECYPVWVEEYDWSGVPWAVEVASRWPTALYVAGFVLGTSTIINIGSALKRRRRLSA